MADQSNLQALVGEWELEAAFEPAPSPGTRGRVQFEWMPGERFLIQRWEVDHPEAPDGLAVIGAADDGYVQHYFDSRGVARVYEISLENGVWRTWRDDPEFSQRFTGRFSDDGSAIECVLERTEPDGTWVHDFDLTYRRR